MAKVEIKKTKTTPEKEEPNLKERARQRYFANKGK